MTTQPAAARPSRPVTSLRVVGVLMVLTLAILGFLAVFGVLSLEAFGDLSIRLAMLAGIAVAACLAIWALTYRRD